MHFKLFLTRTTVLVGGCNWTVWGERENYEIMTEITGKRALIDFNERFKNLWSGLTTRKLDNDGEVSELVGGLPALSELCAMSVTDNGDSASQLARAAQRASEIAPVPDFPARHEHLQNVASSLPGLPPSEINELVRIL